MSQSVNFYAIIVTTNHSIVINFIIIHNVFDFSNTGYMFSLPIQSLYPKGVKGSKEDHKDNYRRTCITYFILKSNNNRIMRVAKVTVSLCVIHMQCILLLWNVLSVSRGIDLTVKHHSQEMN